MDFVIGAYQVRDHQHSLWPTCHQRCIALTLLHIQATVVAHESAAWSTFVRKVKHLPLVLTGENISQQQKLLGIKFGAVDFLEKPVALLKLRNVWQHTVRKVRLLTRSCTSKQ